MKRSHWICVFFVVFFRWCECVVYIMWECAPFSFCCPVCFFFLQKNSFFFPQSWFFHFWHQRHSWNVVIISTFLFFFVRSLCVPVPLSFSLWCEIYKIVCVALKCFWHFRWFTNKNKRLLYVHNAICHQLIDYQAAILSLSYLRNAKNKQRQQQQQQQNHLILDKMLKLCSSFKGVSNERKKKRNWELSENNKYRKEMRRRQKKKWKRKSKQ